MYVAVGFRKQRQQNAKERVQLPGGVVGKKIKASVRAHRKAALNAVAPSVLQLDGGRRPR